MKENLVITLSGQEINGCLPKLFPKRKYAPIFCAYSFMLYFQKNDYHLLFTISGIL